MKTSTAAIRATGIFLMIFAVALALSLGLLFRVTYLSTINNLTDRVATASKIVDTNATWIDALANQALRRIDQELGPTLKPETDSQKDAIVEAMGGLPGHVLAYIVDEKGMVLYSTDPQVKPINITDREYFSHLAKGARRYVSALLISRLSEEQIFVFSRRLERNGRFRGAVILSFDVSLLRQVWESVDLGPGSAVSFIREDGQLVARYPLAEKGLDMSGYILFTQYLRESHTGTYETTSPLDGVRRIVGYRRVAGTEFVAIAAANYDEVMAPFWNRVYIACALATAMLSGLGLSSFWIFKLLRRDHQKSEQLALALARNEHLLAEIHHRVKNNLQAVAALIRLSPTEPDLKKGLINRIGAMTAVHETIYQRGEYADLNITYLVPRLVELVVQGYGKEVDLVFDIEPATIPAERAGPLAQIINEVVSNALKYACTHSEKGRLRVQFKREDDTQLKIAISDNGPGFDPEQVSKGMGSRIVEGAVMQLGGRIEYADEGRTFIAFLPLGGNHES